MLYTITFNSDAAEPREPIAFDAANDGVGLEWLHLLGCGHNAQLWRGDTLLCTLRADLSHGFFQPGLGDDRPVGRGWHCRPQWVDEGEPCESEAAELQAAAPERESENLPVPLPPLRLPTLLDEGEEDAELETKPGRLRRRKPKFTDRDNPDKAEEDTATGVFAFMLRDL